MSRTLLGVARKVGMILTEDSEIPQKGIHGMKFMQMGRDRKRRELEQEAVAFMRALESGTSIEEAGKLSKTARYDDYVQGENDKEDLEERAAKFLMRKRGNNKEAHNDEAVEEVPNAADTTAPSTQHDALMDFVLKQAKNGQRKLGEKPRRDRNGKKPKASDFVDEISTLR